MSSFTEWTMPLHELPKTPELVEERLKDIAEHRQNIFKKTQECIGESDLHLQYHPDSHIKLGRTP